MGTPDFARSALAALVEAGHEIAAVYSQPPRKAGRGMKERPSPVHEFAASQGFKVHTPLSLKTPEAQAVFAAHEAEAAVVAAYGLILPAPILEAPKLGCFNIHASLLPRWRGAAPIQRAIMAGDNETGITIMRMDEGLDTGAMCRIDRIPITPGQSAGALHDALAALGAEAITAALADLAAGQLECRPQPEEGACYAAKISKDEARIDWSGAAADVQNHINGLAPFPGAWFAVGGERIKALGCRSDSGGGAPGEVLDGLRIACGAGAVRLTQVQRAGRKPADAEAFLRGFALAPGTLLT